MKHIIILGIIAILNLELSAQLPKKEPVSKQGMVSLKTPSDSMQYILGAYLGQYIIYNGFVINNSELFFKALNDAINNKPLLVNSETISKKISEYQSIKVYERDSIQEKQLFESIRGKPGIGTLPSGVCYSIIKTGNGLRPLVTDSVELQVKGFLADGKQFEDTYAKNSPYKLTPAGLMPGLSEIIQIMPIGSLWRVYIPAAMAYGDKGITGLIPPRSAVIFEIELLGKK